jgi:hypothetical protein
MNIVWGYNQFCVLSGHQLENSPLQESKHNINGFGFMDSFIQSQEKIKAWILPDTNTQLFNRVLADFAREFQLNRNKRILLVLDQAGWHISHKLELPEGLDLFFLPAHSPELQPAERLWPLTNEAIANHTVRSLSELEELLVIRCQKLLKQQDLVRGLTCYHWWPKMRVV